MRPRRGTWPRCAVVTAPAIAPAPKLERSALKPPTPVLRTSPAITGRYVISGKASSAPAAPSRVRLESRGSWATWRRPARRL